MTHEPKADHQVMILRRGSIKAALELVLNHCEADSEASIHNPHLVKLAAACRTLRDASLIQEMLGTYRPKRARPDIEAKRREAHGN